MTKFTTSFLVVSTIAAATALAIVPVKQSVSAAQNNDAYSSNEVASSLSQRASSSSENIQDFDSAVSVQNNQFVLDKSNPMLNSQSISHVDEALAQANAEVREHGYAIDPQTKEIKTKTRFVRSYGHEVRRYWWGSRHIFRTNNDIYAFIRNLQSMSIATGLAALVPGISAPMGIGAAYLTKLASDLSYNQSIHPHDKIYMDINNAFIYSIGVWHD